jgi:uncharacterized protein YndB with AHSA1/START domain
MSKTIRQSVTIKATPTRVFEALIDERRHTKFTGAPAVISRRVGGAFTCFGGYLSGINLDVVPGRRIVQAWRSKNWPEGYYSVVTFALAKAAGGRTRLTFTQLGVPAGDFKGKSEGWRERYWKPLKAHLEG